MFLGVFFLFMLNGCVHLTVVPKTLPEKSPDISKSGSEKIAVKYCDIYLSKKVFDQIDLTKVIEMEEETPAYVITCKSYEIDLKKSILTANGVMVIANTTSQNIGKNGEDLAPIKMWANKMQINLSLTNGWHTCVIVEKADKQYFVSAYGRVHKLGAPYELVLPQTKIN